MSVHRTSTGYGRRAIRVPVVWSIFGSDASPCKVFRKSKAGRLTYSACCRERAWKLAPPSFDDAGHLLNAGQDGRAGLENICRIN
jgi:hypothetical protein